jgi:ribosomal protein S24E
MDFPKKPTPSQAVIKKEIASHVKAEENRVAIKFIDQQFGTNSAFITVHVYKDEASLKRTEEIKKRKKKEGAANVQEGQAKK